MNNKFTCFFRENGENGYLSNWYLSEFKVGDIAFNSGEQYMMYRKAIQFNDKNTADKILLSSDMREIKRLGREVKNYNDNEWSSIRQEVVYEGLVEKFRQNNELLRLLLNTGDSILVECSPYDRIWGIGLSMYDPDRFNMNKWLGSNLLGYTLMKVRYTLR